MEIQRREIKKTKRNKELLSDYNGGLSMIDMVAKYRISSSRIYQIIKDHEQETR